MYPNVDIHDYIWSNQIVIFRDSLMGVVSMKGGDGEHSYANNSEAQVCTSL